MDVFCSDIHTPEYYIHKYWARKPHNVVSSFVKKYAKEGKSVLDPFCGSCVTNIEAIKLGYNTIGIDINPIAILIGKASTTKILINDLEKEYHKIIEELKNDFEKIYSYKGKIIRYCVHEIQVKCNECNNNFYYSELKKDKSAKCPNCNKKIILNLNNIIGTRVIGVSFKGEKETSADEVLLNLETRSSLKQHANNDISNYDNTLIENKRILAYKGTTTKSFFTPRAFSVLANIADKIHSIKDENVKSALLLVLTSTSTQCSKLIPYRDNLQSGGPAWSVPGFWIPPKHLEYNPILAFQSRYKKILKAISTTSFFLHKNSKATFYNGHLEDCLKKIDKNEVGYIFADPPYGDSVPYLEVSSIWNSWLKKKPDYEKEVVVSDSTLRNKNYQRYKLELINAVKAISEKMNENTNITFTFNQLSLDAWESLLTAIKSDDLTFENVSLVFPPVIPAKARFSVKGSYIGDFYLTFKKTPNSKKEKSVEEYFNSIDIIFRKTAKTRNGLFPYPLIIRIFINKFLELWPPIEVFKSIKEYLKTEFSQTNNSEFFYNKFGYVDLAEKPIYGELRKKIKKILLNGGRAEWYIIKYIYSNYDIFDAPEVSEIHEVLANMCIKKNKLFYLKHTKLTETLNIS